MLFLRLRDALAEARAVAEKIFSFTNRFCGITNEKKKANDERFVLFILVSRRELASKTDRNVLVDVIII